MNSPLPPPEAPAGAVGETALLANPVALALRAVHRAMAELRRGTPVLLTDGGEALVLAAAETVGAPGLAELAALARAPALLLLAPARAEALLPGARPGSGGPAALALPPGLLDPARLRRLADPTAEELPPLEARAEPAPPLAGAALALAKLARLLPAVIAAPVDAAGLVDAAARLGLLRLDVAAVAAYPAAAATSLRRVAEASVPLDLAAETRLVAFRAGDGGIEHLAILVGAPERLAAAGGAPLARIHSECFTGDLLGSLRCDCGPQLRGALARMAEAGDGVMLYLAQEGRGIGLVNKLRAYQLQDRGLDTLDANRALGYGADERNFLVAGTMLEALGIGRVRLLTNNPEKLQGLSACGIEVVGREPHSFAPNGVNDGYLATKARRFGHLLG
jgi:GTP cyclohydrolase II